MYMMDLLQIVCSLVSKLECYAVYWMILNMCFSHRIEHSFARANFHTLRDVIVGGGDFEALKLSKSESRNITEA